MKIYLHEIKEQLGKIDKSYYLPSDFLDLKKSDGYVIYYNFIKSNAIDIKYTEKIKFINNAELLRRRMEKQAGYYAIYKEPFDTQEVLFYYMIKFYVGDDTANKFFGLYKSKDIELSEQYINNRSKFVGIWKINNRSNLETALNHLMLHSLDINSVLNIVDIINQYTINNFDCSLYSVIDSIVKAMRSPSGGLVPQYNGEMKYMMVGINNVKIKEDEELEKAQSMIRGGADINNVKITTGWHYNSCDGKFRKKISDKSSEFSDLYLHETPKFSKIYIPKGSVLDDVKQLLSNNNLDARDLKNYNGRLSDVLKHETLYEYYPQLSTYKLIFGLYKENENQNKSYMAFNSPTDRFIFIRIPDNDDAHYVLLHEVQHAIQVIEGFARGGDLQFAQVIQSIGGENARIYMNNVNFLLSKFGMMSENEQQNLMSYFEFVFRNQPNKDRMLSRIKTMIEDKQTSEIITIFVNSIAKFKDKLTASQLLDQYFSESISFACVDIIDACNESKKLSNNLLRQGWSELEVRALLFRTYQMLFGEIESRFTQNTAFVDDFLSDYFNYYSSEKFDNDKINCIFSNAELNYTNVDGATEIYKDNDKRKYVIHLYSNQKPIPFLHELSHVIKDITYDTFSELYHKAEEEEYKITNRTLKYKSFDEFVAFIFLQYLYEKDISSTISQAIENYIKLNKVYHPKNLYQIFDSIFNYSEDMKKNKYDYLEYCKKLMELI